MRLLLLAMAAQKAASNCDSLDGDTLTVDISLDDRNGSFASNVSCSGDSSFEPCLQKYTGLISWNNGDNVTAGVKLDTKLLDDNLWATISWAGSSFSSELFCQNDQVYAQGVYNMETSGGKIWDSPVCPADSSLVLQEALYGGFVVAGLACVAFTFFALRRRRDAAYLDPTPLIAAVDRPDGKIVEEENIPPGATVFFSPLNSNVPSVTAEPTDPKAAENHGLEVVEAEAFTVV